MYVTDRERQNAEDFLTDVAENLTCQVCGGAEWVIEKVAVMDLVDTEDGPEQLADEGQIFAALQCQHCTHTIFFSADIMDGTGVDRSEATDE